MSKIEVRSAGHRGRGVFATAAIELGEIITADPVVELDPIDVGSLAHTALANYWWNWKRPGGAVAFGPSSMMNNERHSNAFIERDIEGAQLIVKAARTIRAGDEITLDYEKA